MIQAGVNIPADKVREGLRLAMRVGLPEVEVDRPTFYLPLVSVATAEQDSEGVPFDVASPVTIEQPAGVQVPCAYEEIARDGRDVDFATVTPTRLKLTILDEDLAPVAGFVRVVIAGEPFAYEREGTPLGLGEVTVHTIYLIAQDDS